MDELSRALQSNRKGTAKFLAWFFFSSLYIQYLKQIKEIKNVGNLTFHKVVIFPSTIWSIWRCASFKWKALWSNSLCSWFAIFPSGFIDLDRMIIDVYLMLTGTILSAVSVSSFGLTLSYTHAVERLSNLSKASWVITDRAGLWTREANSRAPLLISVLFTTW